MFANDKHPKLLPLNHMARRLRVPLRWLRAEATAGRIPCLLADRAILFDPDAVDRVLLERAQKPIGGGDHA